MKDRRKYSYLVPIWLFLLLLVLFISPKDKKASPGVTIAETMNADTSRSPERGEPAEETVLTSPGTKAQTEDEDRSQSPERDDPAEEPMFASPETEVQTETEKAHVIEGILSYADADRFPVDTVFASQQSVELVAGIYEEIGFEGEFQSGDRAVFDFYRKKFALLLDGKVKVYDSDGDESLLYNRYLSEGRHQINIQDGDSLYFFDMDGDGAPELCVQGASGLYICKYDAVSDRYTEWWGTTNSGCSVIGTRRITSDHSGDTEYFYLLNRDGYTECRIIFNISYHSENLYMVSVPDFEERVRDGQIPDSMKQQVVYDEFWSIYYLRVTEEQYEELIEGLYEAREAAETHQVSFSYFFDSED